MSTNYERYVPMGHKHDDVKTRIYSGSVSAGGGTVLISLSTQVNLLGLVYTPATAGAGEVYFAESALGVPDANGDDHIVFGLYGANGGEGGGYGPYFPKASKGNREIVGKGIDGLVRVRAFFYETLQGQ